MNKPEQPTLSPTPVNGEGQSSPSNQSTADTISRSFLGFFNTKIVPFLIALFVIGILLLFVNFSHLSDTLVESMAKRSAGRYAQIISEVRRLYTSEVVSRVTGHGIAVTHEYANKEAAIPLPATFAKLLVKRIEDIYDDMDGIQIRLISHYPFPWEKSTRELDGFEQEALLQIEANPTQPYFRMDTLHGKAVLRYALGDVMNETCVNCHNNHPDSPKKDWKVGEVRGILEIIQPTQEAISQVRRDLSGTWLILLILVITGIGASVLVIVNMRRETQMLEERVKFRTNSLSEMNKELNQSLEDQKNSQLKFQRVLEAAPDPVLLVDKALQIIFVNAQTISLFGYSHNEIVGHPVVTFLPKFPEITSSLPVMENEMKSDHNNPFVPNQELTVNRKNGETCLVEVSFATIDDSETSLFLIMMRDTTLRRGLEAQLLQAQKMESIGQLAAGIAHEINTPTQFVSDNLRFLTDSFHDVQKVLEAYATMVRALPPGAVDPQLLLEIDATLAEADLTYVTAEIPKALQQSLDGAERVANIVRAMKDFSHPGSTEKILYNVNKAIESTITVARNEWKYVAEMVTQFDPALPLVSCLPGEFNQVILNLLVNAAHAIESVGGRTDDHKGTITVTTRIQNDGVEIRIADTGTGIPESARHKIFEPFFTTKEVGKGTGQGLAIAHNVIVKKHGGRLTFDTQMGQGTTFIIYLPPAAVLAETVTS